MLRTIQKATHVIRPLAAASRPGASQHGLCSMSSSALRTVSRSGYPPKLSRGQYSAREYATNASGASPYDSKDKQWLNYLETVSKAPWLSSTPSNPEDVLKRSYFLVFQIILYLIRPVGKENEDSRTASINFLLLFTSTPVRPDTEIGRARYAVAILTKQLSKDLSSISSYSSLRKQHTKIFELADALASPCDTYLSHLQQNNPPGTGEVVKRGKWQDFWSQVQSTVLTLGDALKEAGYGITDEMLDEAKGQGQGNRKK